MTQEPNPYRPPAASVDAATDADGDPRMAAGKGRRFATFVIDYIGFVIFSMLIGALVVMVSGQRFLFLFGGLWSYLTGAVMMSAYYLFFEGLWQRTPGKLVAGTIVTDLEGRSPSTGAIVKRTLARLVPFEAFTFFGSNGFHDRASRTKVLRTR
ncbi:MAG TPA: RDD family protein [Burkholderiaceae bacterium]